MAIVLGAVAAGAWLLSIFSRMRRMQPEAASALSNNIQSTATVIGAVASAVSMILGALWGRPADGVKVPTTASATPLRLGTDAA